MSCIAGCLGIWPSCMAQTLTLDFTHKCFNNSLEAPFKAIVVWEIKKLWCPFSCKFMYEFGWNLVCCHNPLGLLKVMLNVYCTSTIQGRKVLKWFYKMYIQYRHVWEHKLSMMLNTLKLYSLIPVWMALIFTFQLTGLQERKLELVQSSSCKVAWSNWSVRGVDFVREMTVKKCCKYGEYGSHEHLLFLLRLFLLDLMGLLKACTFLHILQNLTEASL